MTEKLANDITSVAMLVSLRITKWGARVSDRDAATKLAKESEAEADAVSVIKTLVPKQAREEIDRTASKIRSIFYHYTLPWLDNGTRILPVNLYHPFMNELVPAKTAFDSAVAEFINELPNLRKQAEKRVGSLFREAEFPTDERVKALFSVRCPIQPFAQSASFNDFRVSLSKEAIEMMRKDYEEELDQRLSEATVTICARIAEVVGRMADGLERYGTKDEDSKRARTFHQSVIEKVRGLVSVVGELNVTNNPKIAEIMSQIESELSFWDADDLKKNDALRAGVAEQAKAILEKTNAAKAELMGDNYFGV